MSERADRHERLAEEVRRKARRMRRARSRRRSFWRHLGHVGALGWMLVTPVVGGVLLGRALAGWLEVRSLTLIGLLVGLMIGLYTTGWHIRRTLTSDEDDDEETPLSGGGDDV